MQDIAPHFVLHGMYMNICECVCIDYIDVQIAYNVQDNNMIS